MNEKQRERWGAVRAKGRARFVLRNAVAAASCAAAGLALVWLSAYAWRGEPAPHFFRNAAVSAAVVAAAALAGYLQASRAWARNESEY